MLSPSKIVRLAVQERFGRLLEEVTRNGHPLPEPLKARLAQPGNLAVSAIALGLRRLLELEQYGGSARTDLAALVAMLREACDSPGVGRAALAMALGAVADASDQQRHSPWVVATAGVTDDSALGFDALTRSLAARLGLVGATGSEHRSSDEWDSLDAATLAWQLSSASGLKTIAPGLAGRMRRIEARAESSVRSDPAVGDLLRLARVGATDGRRAA